MGGGTVSKEMEMNILIVGLDNSGKSSILNQLKPVDPNNLTNTAEVAPTIGFNEEKFIKNNILYNFHDMSG